MTAERILLYPKKSHRKQVSLPRRSEALAEFFGIMLGDGGINNAWQANITINAITDKVYEKYVVELIKSLFSVEPAVRNRRNSNALVICISSTTIVNFLVKNGLVRGNKIRSGAKIPGWILRSRKYRQACVRGLVDTDGCLYIHRHTIAGREYKNIGLCFSNGAEILLGQVATIFEEFSIIPHISSDGRKIYLYSKEAVERYLTVFGTSNKRISEVYTVWRRG